MHFLLQNVNLAAIYVVFLIVFMSGFFLNVLNVAKNESLRPTLNQPERANSSWSKLVLSTELKAVPSFSPQHPTDPPQLMRFQSRWESCADWLSAESPWGLG